MFRLELLSKYVWSGYQDSRFDHFSEKSFYILKIQLIKLNFLIFVKF